MSAVKIVKSQKSSISLGQKSKHLQQRTDYECKDTTFNDKMQAKTSQTSSRQVSTSKNKKAITLHDFNSQS